MKRRIKKSGCLIMIIIIVAVISIFVLTNGDKKESELINDKANKEVSGAKSEPVEKRMSLIAVGDVLIHESVYLDAKDGDLYNFHKMFTNVEPIISKYDLKFCNQESTIGGEVLGISGYPSFNSPDAIGDEIVDLGFNLISLANNHALDKGLDAVLYSNSYWKTKNVVTAGAYSSMEERNEIKVYEKNGIKYSFLAYTTLSNGRVPNNYIINMYSDEKIKQDIDKVKDKVDVIIVSMHWGEEYTNTPTNEEKRIAQYLSDLGVDLVIGHHPHVVQPVEYINKTLVIYSLGNFISNQLSIELNRGIGLMVGVDIVVGEDGVRFENLYKELILAYADHSTKFDVIPFSKLDEEHLSNYNEVNEKYMSIVSGD